MHFLFPKNKMHMDLKRLTAIKSEIGYIITGQYVKQEGMNPNYVLSKNGRILSRVCILGTVVEKYESENLSSITADDGTGTINAKAFKSNILKSVTKSDLVDVIGKIREYNNEIYIAPESCVILHDPNWEILRKLELERDKKIWEKKRSKILELQKYAADLSELAQLCDHAGITQQELEAVLVSNEPEEIKASGEDRKKIMELIEQSENVCDYAVLLEKSGLPESILDSIINELLEEGTCFEPVPGKIRKI